MTTRFTQQNCNYDFQEAEALLASGKPDEDALTRGQQKQLEKIHAEKPTPKKSKMARDSTMVNTAKVRAVVLMIRTNAQQVRHRHGMVLDMVMDMYLMCSL